MSSAITRNQQPLSYVTSANAKASKAAATAIGAALTVLKSVTAAPIATQISVSKAAAKYPVSKPAAAAPLAPTAAPVAPTDAPVPPTAAAPVAPTDTPLLPSLAAAESPVVAISDVQRVNKHVYANMIGDKIQLRAPQHVDVEQLVMKILFRHQGKMAETPVLKAHRPPTFAERKAQIQRDFEARQKIREECAKNGKPLPWSEYHEVRKEGGGIESSFKLGSEEGLGALPRSAGLLLHGYLNTPERKEREEKKEKDATQGSAAAPAPSASASAQAPDLKVDLD